MFDKIVKKAIDKRDRIIEREGDINGERLQAWYLEQLIQEEIDSVLATAKYSFEGAIKTRSMP